MFRNKKWLPFITARSYGGIMYQSGLGGSIFADGWYAANSTSVVIINVLGTISQELRLNLNNFSSEHLGCQYFLNSQSKIKFTCTGAGFIASNSSYTSASDGFALLKGAGIGYDSEFRFENMRFGTTGHKMYVEQLNTSTGRRNLHFANCSGAKDIYFKFSATDISNSVYTHLSFKGKKDSSNTSKQSDLEISINSHNANGVCC